MKTKISGCPKTLHPSDNLCDIERRLSFCRQLFIVYQVEHALYHFAIHQAITLFGESCHEKLKFLHREHVIIVCIKLLECFYKSLFISALGNIFIKVTGKVFNLD